MVEVLCSALMAQMSSTKVLNSCRCELRKAFIGSIHGSLLPNVVMFARVCKALVISVRVR